MSKKRSDKSENLRSMVYFGAENFGQNPIFNVYNFTGYIYLISRIFFYEVKFQVEVQEIAFVFEFIK